ncbi:cytochrome b561 and DOMON domain-containing protein At5g35735-like isoform X2 [Sesamum indicum]|uniref:Cytochrome b561 and DOMON domain-containing protein At5g35735-like isoform X2 n=1 Tax=Sesamum indicum TaxID=4182 RepID=A0A8M8V4W5_SESIN|nr:cytochrome b561 and DOMON domain-containing protein At5g35735-like isoform X2 [Sesamum indicum]
MNFTSLIIFYIIWCAPSVIARADEGSLLMNSTRKSLRQEIQKQQTEQPVNQNASPETQSNQATDPKPWRSAHISRHHSRLRTVHGTVNIIGWGVLLPVGVIIARYFRKLSDDWYSLHILSQLSGFLLGTLGWGLGLSIKNAAKEQSLSTHGILGTIIFAFATLQAGEEQGCRKYWVIYHHVAGYALIVLIIANIFQGINNQSAAKRWEWVYGTLLGVLGLTALFLELFRFISI